MRKAWAFFCVKKDKPKLALWIYFGSLKYKVGRLLPLPFCGW